MLAPITSLAIVIKAICEQKGALCPRLPRLSSNSTHFYKHLFRRLPITASEKINALIEELRV